MPPGRIKPYRPRVKAQSTGQLESDHDAPFTPTSARVLHTLLGEHTFPSSPIRTDAQPPPPFSRLVRRDLDTTTDGEGTLKP